jgi:TPR repeat protein
MDDHLPTYKAPVSRYALMQSIGQAYCHDHLELAVAYMLGDGVQKDCEKALSLFMEIAEFGNDEAEYAIGVLCLRGDTHLRRDTAAAASWFLRAANRGNVEAQYILGTLYERGMGVAYDYDEAVKWLRIAKDQGHPMAMQRLYVLTADSAALKIGQPERPKQSNARFTVVRTERL